MRHPIKLAAAFAALIALTACGTSDEAEVDRALQELTAGQDGELNEIFLSVADPAEAIAYFSRSLAQDPGNIGLMRGLASSYTRGNRAAEAVPAWQDVTNHPEATMDDRVELAGAFIRTNRWDEAEAMLNSVPPTHETYERYRLEAVIADGNEDWARADSFYEIAAGLTSTPANV